MFRCNYAQCRGGRVDERYSRFADQPPQIMGRILTPRTRTNLDQLGLPLSVQCDDCGHKTSTRICPHCRFTLPDAFGQVKQRTIAILGGPSSGKSHFLAALLKRMSVIAPELHMSIQMSGEASEARWQHEYEVLFTQKTLLPRTKSVEVKPVQQYPIVMRLTHYQGKTRQVCDIGFCDAASVDMLSSDPKYITWYIRNADAIIFLLDPLQISGALPQSDQQRKQLIHGSFLLPEHSLTYLSNLFANEGLLQSKNGITKPVAFTLSKLDLVQPLLDAGSVLHQYPIHTNGIDFENLQSASTDVLALLTKWLSPSLTKSINRDISKHAYFGVSALGTQRGNGNNLTGISPFRVEDPLLWLLAQLQVLV